MTLASLEERTERLYALQAAAIAIADPATALGAKAREELVAKSQLSLQGVDYALRECLEHRAPRAAMSQLARHAPPCRRAHVLLSANVFVAAYRAIALGLAQSPSTFVRASRREPTMASLLHEGSGGAFELVDTLTPQPGDHVWAYGTDDTLRRLALDLPPGVLLHAHGSGLGVAVIGRDAFAREQYLVEAADRLALDMVAFDQRGCMSPRLGVVEGTLEDTRAFGRALARALAKYGQEIPRGTLSDDELADLLRYRDTMIYSAEALPAGRALVVVDPEPDRVIVAPVGRALHLGYTSDAARLLMPLSDTITCVGYAGHDKLEGVLRMAWGNRRFVPLGQMQKPPLDGPADLRHGWTAETI